MLIVGSGWWGSPERNKNVYRKDSQGNLWWAIEWDLWHWVVVWQRDGIGFRTLGHLGHFTLHLQPDASCEMKAAALGQGSWLSTFSPGPNQKMFVTQEPLQRKLLSHISYNDPIRLWKPKTRRTIILQAGNDFRLPFIWNAQFPQIPGILSGFVGPFKQQQQQEQLKEKHLE